VAARLDVLESKASDTKSIAKYKGIGGSDCEKSGQTRAMTLREGKGGFSVFGRAAASPLSSLSLYLDTRQNGINIFP